MAQIKADEITQLLREQIANYDSKVQVDEVGTITSLGDGIARLHGLDKVMAGELLSFPHGIAGLALSLEEDSVGAVILGLGRALGETMAVTMVIGNHPEISKSLFAPGYTLASVIANEFTEATGDMYLSALIEIGLALFLVTIVVNAIARALVWAVTRGAPARVH